MKIFLELFKMRQQSLVIITAISVTLSWSKIIQTHSYNEGSGGEPSHTDHHSGERIICHFNISFDVMNLNGDFM